MGDADLLVPVTPDADKLLAIVQRLAGMTPLEHVSNGHLRCKFCGYDDWLGPLTHGRGCVWQNAHEVLDAQA